MASGTADLQRDLGGALMTSIFGALLTAGYASAMGKAIDAAGADVAADTQAQLQLSFASAESLAQRYPQYAEQITAAARSSFLDGDRWAYAAAMLAVLIGMTLVFRFFPGKEGEERLRASYQPAPCGTGVLGTGPPAHPREERLTRPGRRPGSIAGVEWRSGDPQATHARACGRPER
jgi:hypothetical protein